MILPATADTPSSQSTRDKNKMTLAFIIFAAVIVYVLATRPH